MARNRSPIDRLIDNAGRQIRRLNAKLGSTDNAIRAGALNQQIFNLKAFQNQLRAAKKNGTATPDYIYKKTLEYKENSKFSTSEKAIDKRIQQRVASYEDKEFGTLVENPKYKHIFKGIESIQDRYIGVYAELAERKQASLVMDQIQELRSRNQTLNQLKKDLNRGRITREDYEHALDLNNLRDMEMSDRDMEDLYRIYDKIETAYNERGGYTDEQIFNSRKNKKEKRRRGVFII